jgi:CysZ protein
MRTGPQLSLSFSSYTRAFSFIFTHGLWYYFFFPVVIAILLFMGGIVLLEHLTWAVRNWATGLLGLDADPDSWLMAALGWLISLTIGLIMAWIFFMVKSAFIKYGTLIVLSPVLAMLSERTEQIITGKKHAFNASQFARDVLRGILLAMRNMLVEFGFMLVFFFVSIFVPVAGILIAMLALWLVSWYFYGFSMIDYSNERKRLSISESTAFSWKFRWLCTGSGLWFWLLFTIPWIGVVIAPITGVVAATLAVNDVDLAKAKQA